MTTPEKQGREKCQCSLAIRLCGDGCRYCQPQECIERLIDQIDECNNENDALEAKVEAIAKEIERLLAALEQISHCVIRSTLYPGTPYAQSSDSPTDAAKIAMAVLAQAKPEEV